MIQFEGDNIGGIAKVEILFHNDFLSFDPAVPKDGRNWKDIPFKEQTASLDISVEDSENGPVYSFSGKFTLQRLRPELQSELGPHIGQLNVIRVTDMNNEIYIIGAPDMPVTLSHSGSTGSKYINENGITYSYTIEQPSDFLRA